MDTFLGRALMDPATGFPNIPYFCLIQSWEERRARRRDTRVCVIQLHVEAGGDAVRRALMVGLCQELRTSDLIASDGRNHFRILLTSPDAENSSTIVERIRHLADELNASHPHDGEPLSLAVEMEPPSDVPFPRGPCEPCDEQALHRKMPSGDALWFLRPAKKDGSE